MFRAALRNESLLSRATLRSMPLNYLFPHISSTLDYAAAPSGWWSGHGYCVLDAAMTIMISSRLPQLKLSGHPRNFTLAQLLDYWEASALATLQQKNYSWDATWGQVSHVPPRHLQQYVCSSVWATNHCTNGGLRKPFPKRFANMACEGVNHGNTVTKQT